jgi:hypothetical protein
LEETDTGVPGVTDAYDMVNITKRKLQELVGQYAPCVCKPKQAVVRKDSPQTHCPSVKNGLVAQAAETSMAVYYLDSFANHDISEDREEGEDSREGRLSVDDEEGDVVDLKTIGEVPHTGTAGIGVGDDNHFVASVDEFLELVKT